MNLDRYPYTMGASLLDYEFVSAGPQGEIRKVVQYRLEHTRGSTFFRLGFGDWDESSGTIDDLSVSNNGDRQKVLATIAASVLDITARFPDMMVFARGSTPARTRLYQMAITIHRAAIFPLLTVYGYLNGQWELMERNKNYDAFLVQRK